MSFEHKVRRIIERTSVSGDGNPGGAALPAEFVSPPLGLEAVFPVSVYRSADGIYTTNFDPRAWRNPEQTVIRVSVARGNDTTGTGTVAAPYQTIDKGILMAGSAGTESVTVEVEAGFYNRHECWKGRSVNKNLNVVGLGPVYSSCTFEALTWTAEGNPGVYQATRSTVGGVFDKLVLSADTYDYTRLTNAATLAACRSTLNSWYSDGTTVYVHRLDGAMPTLVNTLCSVNLNNGLNSYGKRVYVENFVFEGGSRPFAANLASGVTGGEVILHNCVMRYGQGNAVENVGLTLLIVNRSLMHGCGADGINDHVGLNGVQPVSVAIDCVSRDLGSDDGADNDNAYTSHDAGQAMRVNCWGGRTRGPVFADIGTSKTWNLGCVSGPSFATTQAYLQSGWMALNTASQRMDGCVDAGSNVNSIYAGGTANVAMRRSSLPRITGTVGTY